MIPSLRDELAAELRREAEAAADRHYQTRAATLTPSTDSPERRRAWRLVSSTLHALAGAPMGAFEARQR